MPAQQFIVMVTHNTGHGPVAQPILLTDDFEKAHNTCQRTDLGYEFIENETGFAVYRVWPGVVSSKNSGITQTLVYWRYRWNDGWRTTWVDLSLQGSVG